MIKPDDKIAKACTQVVDLAERVLQWCDANGALLGPEQSGLVRQTKSYERHATRLAGLVGKRPCVGVAAPQVAARRI